MKRLFPKYCLLVWLLQGLPFLSFAQRQRVYDSLWYQLQNADDTLSLDIYCKLGYYYSETKRDSSIYYCEKAITLARKLNQPFYIAFLLSSKAYCNLSISNYPDAWTDIYEAEKIASDLNIGKNILKTNYSKQYFPNDSPETNRHILLGYIKNSWGLLYGSTRNKEKMFSAYFEGKRLAEIKPIDKFLIAGIYFNMSQAYLTINQLDSALYYQKLSLQAQQHDSIDIYKGANVATLGDFYLQKGDFANAQRYLFKGLQMISQQKEDNWIGLAQTYMSLSEYYRQINKIDSAFYFAQKGFNFYQSMNSHTDLAYAAHVLSNIYVFQNKYDSAYFYIELAKNLGDSLQNLEIDRLSKFQNMGFENQLRLLDFEKQQLLATDKNRLFALSSGLASLLIIAGILYYYNRKRRQTNRVLKKTLSDLKSTQAQLIQSEKLASLGELTAGIAHEIQNPLNFVNNFSELSVDLAKDLNDEIHKPDIDKEYIEELLTDLSQNQEKINIHGKRASNIVKGMLEHSRASTGVKELTDINKLADEYLRLSYHGLRAKDKEFNSDFNTNFDENLPKIEVIPQDIGRVLLNLINNAFYAVNERAKQIRSGNFESFPNVETTQAYTPSVFVTTQQIDNQIVIKVKDNGMGMPESVIAKVFQPFFTTKPTGQGTGLGLSLAYDIVTKGHGGTLEVVSTEGVGSEFTIQLPITFQDKKS
jgi:two-component system, NtrC family, sensor kinase